MHLEHAWQKARLVGSSLWQGSNRKRSVPLDIGHGARTPPAAAKLFLVRTVCYDAFLGTLCNRCAFAPKPGVCRPYGTYITAARCRVIAPLTGRYLGIQRFVSFRPRVCSTMGRQSDLMFEPITPLCINRAACN
jgi:hypothetical protein